jgi:hypothetical protein
MCLYNRLYNPRIKQTEPKASHAKAFRPRLFRWN